MAKKRLNPFQPLLDKLPAPLKNKYVVTLIIFVFILLFVNKVSPWTLYKLNSTESELKEEKAYFEGKRSEVERDQKDNERNVEKFAREHYYMKKSDEDVFIIVNEESEDENKENQ